MVSVVVRMVSVTSLTQPAPAMRAASRAEVEGLALELGPALIFGRGACTRLS